MSESEAPAVLYEVHGHVATITMNRPHVRNAMDRPGYRLLCESIERAAAEDAARVVILTGTDPGFCAGDDVRMLAAQGQPEEAGGEREPLRLPGGALRRCNKPLIAAVNGPAMGYGLEIAILCDFRIASERAQFCALYIRRSLVAPADSWEILPRIVGPERAAEMLLAGDNVSAEQAREYGLVSRLVPHDDLLPMARGFAARLARNAPLALQRATQAIRIARTGDRAALREHINASTRVLNASEDFAESIRAFQERREPVFRGR